MSRRRSGKTTNSEISHSFPLANRPAALQESRVFHLVLLRGGGGIGGGHRQHLDLVQIQVGHVHLGGLEGGEAQTGRTKAKKPAKTPTQPPRRGSESVKATLGKLSKSP